MGQDNLVPNASNDDEYSGTPSLLPTTRDDEFRPFVRKLPEFKFWYVATA